MGIRAGASWRTGSGRRAWVSVPLWLLILAAPLIATAWGLALTVWLLAQLTRLTVLLTASIVQAIREERESRAQHPPAG